MIEADHKSRRTTRTKPPRIPSAHCHPPPLQPLAYYPLIHQPAFLSSHQPARLATHTSIALSSALLPPPPLPIREGGGRSWVDVGLGAIKKSQHQSSNHSQTSHTFASPDHSSLAPQANFQTRTRHIKLTPVMCKHVFLRNVTALNNLP